MKRRIAPNLLLLCTAAVPGAATAASWLDEHRLRVRRDVEDELRLLSASEFAPLPPEDARRALQSRPEQGLRGAGDGNDGGCSSPLIQWTTDRVRDMGYTAYKTLHDNKIVQLAYVYKHYIDRDHEDERFVDDAQTAELHRRHRETIAFWSAADVDNTIMTDDVLLLSMHGSDLADDGNLVPTIQRLFDFDEMSDVLAFAAKVKGLISDLPDGYDNPLLTMNAVATRSTRGHGTYNGHDDPSRRHKDSIIIGDGVLKFLYDNGLEGSGPDFVHAHEFGHHLQFQIVDNLTKKKHGGGGGGAAPAFADDDRKKELMADAIGGYFLAHDRGGNMLAHEIQEYGDAAFGTGDCAMGEDDHHGTPKQRRCAAIWGASRAAADNVPILDAEVFVKRFREAYDGILDLDREECTLVLEETSLDTPSIGDAGEDEWIATEEVGEGGGVKLDDWLDAQNQQRVEDQNDQQREEDEGSSGIDLEGWLDRIQEQNKHNVASRGEPTRAAPPAHTLADRRPAASTNLADVGSPAETRPSYVQHGVTVQDCHLPWVYCSSAAAAGGRTNVASLAMAAAFLVLF